MTDLSILQVHELSSRVAPTAGFAEFSEICRRATAGEAAAKERDSEWARRIGALRSIARRIVEAIGADGPEDADHAVGRMIDKLAEVQQERDRLAKVAGNAEQGDCLRGELGTVECPVDAPCGVCKLTRERDTYKSECEQISAELGLPPSMRPVEGWLSAMIATTARLGDERDAALARVAAFEAQRDRRWQSVKGYLTKATDGMDWAQMIRHFAEAEKAALGKLAETEKQRDAALERLRMLAHSACLEWTSGPGINGILVTDRSWDALGTELKLTRKFLERIEPQPSPARPMPVETFTEAPNPPWSGVIVTGDTCVCSDPGPHFCPPSMGEHGFYACRPDLFPKSPKPPPADEPALARLRITYFAHEAHALLTSAILELARRPR